MTPDNLILYTYAQIEKIKRDAYEAGYAAGFKKATRAAKKTPAKQEIKFGDEIVKVRRAVKESKSE